MADAVLLFVTLFVMVCLLDVAVRKRQETATLSDVISPGSLSLSTHVNRIAGALRNHTRNVGLHKLHNDPDASRSDHATHTGHVFNLHT